MQTFDKKGLTVKDLVTVGIFSALFLVFALVGGIFFAPNLYFHFALVALIAALAALSGKGRCALRGLVAYALICAFTVWCMGALNDTAVEYIGGIEVIKAFGKAKSSYEKFVVAARECAQSYIDWMNRSNFYFTFAMNIMPATLLTVLPIGGLLMKNGSLSPERCVMIVILSMGLITPSSAA